MFAGGVESDLVGGTVLCGTGQRDANLQQTQPGGIRSFRGQTRGGLAGHREGSDASGQRHRRDVVELGWEVGGTFDRAATYQIRASLRSVRDAQLIGRHGEEVSPTDKWRAPSPVRCSTLQYVILLMLQTFHQAAG